MMVFKQGGFIRIISSLLCLLIRLLNVSEAVEYAYTIVVPPSRIECFFQNATDDKYTSMEVDFQVIDGGDMDINFMVVDPMQKTVAQFLKRQDATQRIDLTVKGDYQLCFDNTFSYQEKKTVFFEMFLYDKDGNLDDDVFDDYDGLADIDYEALDGMSKDTMTVRESLFLETISSRVKQNLNKAEHYQALLRAWEYRDRAIMDSNFNRVNWWSVVNSAVLMTVGAIQVFMIRRLFQDNSRTAKIMQQRT